MEKRKSPPANFEEYLEFFPDETQQKLRLLRATIINAAPKAEEIISYQMPAFKYFGRLVYFAAFKNHIGFYPMVSGIKAFSKEVAVYKHAKGSVQFPLDEKLPVSLIKKIIQFRVKENEIKFGMKKKK